MSDRSLDKEIGEKLKQQRERKGYSMREVGERLNIDHSYVSKIEKGYIPSMKLLREIADLYDIPLSYLFGEIKEVPDELKEIGVDLIAFGKYMKEENLTTEKVKEYVEIVKRIQSNL